MPNYQNGKIYKIESLEGDCVYYGSTTQKLCLRMGEHRKHYRYNRDITSKQVLCFNDAKIYLVENYPCNSKEELHAREGYYIKNNVCINKNIPGRDQKQYYNENKEQILKYRKKYYIDNKEDVLKQHKKYYQENKEDVLKHQKQYYKENKEDVIKYKKQYYQENKEDVIKHQKQYYEKHKENIITYNKEYREKNRQLIREKKRQKHICECGISIQISAKSKHQKSEKHKALISNPFINFKL